MKRWVAILGIFALATVSLSSQASFNQRWQFQAEPSTAVSTSQPSQVLAVMPGVIRIPGLSIPNYATQTMSEHLKEFDPKWDSFRTFPLTQTLDRPVLVYVNTQPNQPQLYQAQYQQLVTQALDAWKNALDGRLNYQFVDNPKQANIVVDWVSSFSEASHAGETTVSVGKAKVVLRTGDGIEDQQLLGNIMHELGHAFGIAGHSDTNDDIMKSGREWSSYQEYAHYQAKLSARDINAIRRLYSVAWVRGEDLYQAQEDIAGTQVTLKYP